jgi:hypothetical protein
MKTLKRGYFLPIALLTASVGSILTSASVSAAQFGGFSLKPMEAQQVQIGSRYLNMRVCNDLGSAGSLSVGVGNHDPHILAPGECMENAGDNIRLQNQAAGMVAGTYQPFGNNNSTR